MLPRLQTGRVVNTGIWGGFCTLHLSVEGGHCLGTSYTGHYGGAKTEGLWFELL